MNRLLEIGFELAGHWRLVDDALSLQLARHALQRNILYAFVSDGEVKYVGKTTQPLRTRLNGQRHKPGHEDRSPRDESPDPVASIPLVLQPTYFKTGFFNGEFRHLCGLALMLDRNVAFSEAWRGYSMTVQQE